MRNARALMMIGISLIAGLLAIVLAARWLNQQTSMATRKVAVAAVDLNVGQPLTSEQIRLIDWPTGSVPEGTFPEMSGVEGRVTKINLLRDEPILESKLAPKGSKGGLSAVITEGKRAITVRVNDVVGVAGFALPGNYVDVVVNTRDERSAQTEQSISKIVLERILVLAVAQEAGRDDTKPKVVNAVTLEVTPEQAEAIDLARSVGQLSLVLRNQVDPKPVQTAGVTKATLLGVVQTETGPRPAPRRGTAPARPRTCIETLAGTERSLECF